MIFQPWLVVLYTGLYHLKMDGWKTSFLLGPGLFSAAFAVSFRDYITQLYQELDIDDPLCSFRVGYPTKTGRRKQKSTAVLGSRKRWDWWHIIPHLAVYTTYIPFIYCLRLGVISYRSHLLRKTKTTKVHLRTLPGSPHRCDATAAHGCRELGEARGQGLKCFFWRLALFKRKKGAVIQNPGCLLYIYIYT